MKQTLKCAPDNISTRLSRNPKTNIVEGSHELGDCHTKYDNTQKENSYGFVVPSSSNVSAPSSATFTADLFKG